ncbi:hypothetical protein RSAG8_12634, partial [Rhizoctonia solani AG-8 WAC10335]
MLDSISDRQFDQRLRSRNQRLKIFSLIAGLTSWASSSHYKPPVNHFRAVSFKDPPPILNGRRWAPWNPKVQIIQIFGKIGRSIAFLCEFLGKIRTKCRIIHDSGVHRGVLGECNLISDSDPKSSLSFTAPHASDCPLLPYTSPTVVTSPLPSVRARFGIKLVQSLINKYPTDAPLSKDAREYDTVVRCGR